MQKAGDHTGSPLPAYASGTLHSSFVFKRENAVLPYDVADSFC
ncbi:MAG: hypothetical protein ACI4IX_09660 [Acutalibacteraceae bacterium]